MKTLSERQAHMIRVIKTVDRALVEQAGLEARVISHLQTPHAAPGEREAVCVYREGGVRQHVPYGIELERQVNDARRWVREGEGPKPLVARNEQGQVEIVGRAAADRQIALEGGALSLPGRSGKRT